MLSVVSNCSTFELLSAAASLAMGCTLYSVHYTVYSVQYTVYSVSCKA